VIGVCSSVGVLLLVFGIALVTATLLSNWFHRTVLSSAVLFLGFGFATGPAGLGLVTIDVESSLLAQVSELALFSILFSDGLKVGWSELRRGWRLPARALLIGMPLTAAAIALAAHLLFDLRWIPAFLVGTILSPTDPVLASAIVGREEIPGRVRHLLNVESGLNDGLALPFVLLLLSMESHAASEPWTLAGEVAGGILIGVAIAAATGWLRNLRIFSVVSPQESLFPFAVAVAILASARATGWNEFLAAYAGGLTLATVSPASREEFHDVGERLNEVLKLAAVLAVAVALTTLAVPVTWRDLLFAALVLTVARSAAITLALRATALTRTERLVAAWFGPKGFASIIYGLLLLRSGIADAEPLFNVVALTTVISMILHSSTDVPVAHYFRRRHRVLAET